MSIQGCEKVGFPLWRKVVDKSVENVENSQLSTGILPVYTEAPGGRENGRFVPGKENEFPVCREGGQLESSLIFGKKVGSYGKTTDKGEPGIFRAPKNLWIIHNP